MKTTLFPLTNRCIRLILIVTAPVLLLTLTSCQSTQKSNPAVTSLSNEIEEANQKIAEIYHRLSVVQFMVDNHQRSLAALENQIGVKTPQKTPAGTKTPADTVTDTSPAVEKNQPEETAVTESPIPNETPAAPEEATADELSADILYNQGFAALKAKNYTKAISLFKTLVAQYPAHDLADNAIYWTGEIHYTHQEFPSAILTFQKLIDNYPDGGKVPDALLKIGYSYYSMNDTISAKKYLKKVIVDFPFTYSGSKAEEMLKQIDKLN